MRKELYNLLCQKLKEIDDGAIKYIDLWNRNVEFIEQEEPWERPAVFIEFGPITWKPTSGKREYRGEGLVKFHIVTDWNGSASSDSELREGALSVFDFSEKIQSALLQLKGKTFYGFDLVETDTNHDHEEIMENIEVYKLRCVRSL